MALGLGNIKDLVKMQQEGKKMQDQMKKLVIEGHSKDDKVLYKIDGTMELLDIEIDEELLNPLMGDVLKKYILEAAKDAHKKLQKEMMKDMDINKIKSMLGS